MERDEFTARLVGLRETRARLPELVRNRHASRRRRSFLGHRGRLLLIEVDPLMLVASASDGDHGLDRGTLLWRIGEALSVPGVDGVIGTVDVVDDLLLLEQLDDRVALGILNHPGHADGWTSDDGHPSGYAPATIHASHLDGGLVRLRLDLGDPRLAATLEAAAAAITVLSAESAVTMVAPTWWDGRAVEDGPDTAVLPQVKAVTTASALGSRSAYTWLVLPVGESLAEAVAATTLPVLVRVADAPTGVVGLDDEAASWQQGLGHSGVRGLVLPASRLFVESEDPLAVVRAAADAVSASAGRQDT
jgi:hypothetical protein